MLHVSSYGIADLFSRKQVVNIARSISAILRMCWEDSADLVTRLLFYPCHFTEELILPCSHFTVQSRNYHSMTFAQVLQQEGDTTTNTAQAEAEGEEGKEVAEAAEEGGEEGGL